MPASFGKQFAADGFFVHAHFEQGHQPLCLLIEQANLDHVVFEHVLRAVQDVRLEHVDALLDGHGEDFFRLEVGQLAAGVLNCFELLLLERFDRDVANRHHQVPRVVLSDR